MKKAYLLLFLTCLFFGTHANLPDVKWAYNLGGWANDYANSMVVDDSNNVYITGYFIGTMDFDPGPDSLMLNSNGSRDLFVQKIDSAGNMIWTKTIGGFADEYAFDIQLDNNNDLVIIGNYAGSVDFDPGAGADSLHSNGNFDIFLLKLDAQGQYIWAKSVGGPFGDAGYALAIDNSNNIYSTGYFRSIADFNPGSGVFNLNTNTNSDIFVLKLDEFGDFLWALNFGSDNWDQGRQMTLDIYGNPIVSGWFRDTVDFDPGVNTLILNSEGSNNSFVQKLDANGNLMWAKGITGNSDVQNRGIAVDKFNNVLITGEFNDTADFDPGPIVNNRISSGSNDIYLQKMDENGNLLWYNTYGSSDYDYGTQVTVDVNNNILLAGSFYNSVDFDPGPGSFVLNSQNYSDAFLQKLDENGNFIWTYSVGSSGSDQILEIVPTNNGELYISGSFSDTIDIDPGTNYFPLISKGSTDLFIKKLQDSVNLEVVGLSMNTGNNLIVYPNPFETYLKVKSEEGKIKSLMLRDIRGGVLYSYNTIDKREFEFNPNLKRGIYFLEVIDEHKRTVHKVIKD